MQKMHMPCSAAIKGLPVLSRSAVFIRHISQPLLQVTGCSDLQKYHPVDDLDAEAWNALNLRTRYYTTRLHKGAFYLPAFLEDMLKEVED